MLLQNIWQAVLIFNNHGESFNHISIKAWELFRRLIFLFLHRNCNKKKWLLSTNRTPSSAMLMMMMCLSSSFFTRSECVEMAEAPNVFFCCCDISLCNMKFFHRPRISELSTTRKIHLSPWSLAVCHSAKKSWLYDKDLSAIFECWRLNQKLQMKNLCLSPNLQIVSSCFKTAGVDHSACRSTHFIYLWGNGSAY